MDIFNLLFNFYFIIFLSKPFYVFDKVGVFDWIIRTKFLIPLASILNGLAFETIGIFFFNLKWDKAIIGAKNMRYFPIVYIMGLYIISKAIKIPKKEKNGSKKIEEGDNKKVQ